jgi:hypothetical protein
LHVRHAARAFHLQILAWGCRLNSGVLDFSKAVSDRGESQETVD